MPAEIAVFPTAAAVAEALADRTAAALRTALAGAPRVSLCLTGGSTPEPAYRRLATADGIDWDRVHLFWTDERCVGPDHPDSNAGMAIRALVEPAGVPETNVHRFRGELGGNEAAADMERELEAFFGADGVRFDVLHLGMGPDGHIASLFPDRDALGETDRRAVATIAPDSMAIADRVTLTYPVLDAARLTLFAATGARKYDALSSAFDVSAPRPDEVALRTGLPVARLSTERAFVWLIDRDLAEGLDTGTA